MLVAISLIKLSSVAAQVTLEHSYGFYHTYFWVTDIGNNEYKYVLEDSSGFSVYNLDHSPYLLNIVPPIPIFVPPNFYEISYLTKSLFDCDSTNVEYVLSAPKYNGNFYVYRTDGTQIFARDSVTGPFCTGCQGGSIYTEPIFNSPDGAKLLLFTRSAILGGDPDSMYVYSLCGSLPVVVHKLNDPENFVKVFPNPSNGIINFEISFPNNTEKFQLTIYNSLFQKVDESRVNGKSYQLDVTQKSLSPGTYLFDLRTETQVFQTGRFIISK